MSNYPKLAKLIGGHSDGMVIKYKGNMPVLIKRLGVGMDIEHYIIQKEDISDNAHHIKYNLDKEFKG